MRKHLLIFAVFFPVAVNAQTLGCYVTSFQPNQCSFTHIQCSGNTSLDQLQHGFVVADLCQDIYFQADQLTQCNTAYNQYVAAYNTALSAVATAANERDFYKLHWSACGNTNDQIRGAIGYWEGLTHYYEGLTARLRSKCGSKCKKVQ